MRRTLHLLSSHVETRQSEKNQETGAMTQRVTRGIRRQDASTRNEYENHNHTVSRKGNTMIEQERYLRARARVQQLRNFYVHAAVYVFVNLLLLLINLLTDASSLWFYWPLLGWGIAVAVHAFLVYGV